MTLNIAIAIFAHNEEKMLPRLIRDLRQQTVMDSTAYRISIHVLSNGSTDGTVRCSQVSFDAESFDPARITPIVHDIETPGKTNAWNHFVSTLLNDTEDYVMMMDADIRMPQSDLIERCVGSLGDRPNTWVTSDVTRNCFPREPRISLVRALMRLYENSGVVDQHRICGQFYCIRADILRKMALPAGLLSQDGFLCAMILTSALTEPENPDRIYVVPDTHHLHTVYVTLADITRYQVRQAISSAIYRIIYDDVSKLPPSFEERMQEISRRNVVHPGWVEELIARAAASDEPLVLRRYKYRRLRNAWNARGLRKLKAILLLPAVLYDVWIGHLSERALRSLSVGTVAKNAGQFKIRTG